MASLDADRCYECQTCLYNCNSLIGCSFCKTTSFSFYCDSCVNCSNCFGCVGLRNKEYCILNKQYDSATYRQMVVEIARIMAEDGSWGQFFPPEFSPHFGLPEVEPNQKFKLTQFEQEFYHQHGLSEPTLHPELRHQNRLARRAPRRMLARKCVKCAKEIMSVFCEDFVSVHCIECYQAILHG